MTRYNCVVAMVEAIDDERFAGRVARRIAERTIVRRLIVKRACLGMSIEDVARKIGCRVSRVKGIEAGVDAELTVKDLRDYARAVGIEKLVLTV